MTPAIALPGDTFVAWMAIIVCGGLIIRDRIVVALAWLDRKNAEDDAAIAAILNEPTRAEVEQPPTDAEADHEWAAILAAVGLTPEDVRRRWLAAGGEAS